MTNANQTPFASHPHLTAKQNIQRFIKYVKENTAKKFQHIEFDSHVWSTKGLEKRAYRNRWIYFAKIEFNAFKSKGRSHIHQSNPAVILDTEVMSEPFCSTAKALFMYCYLYKERSTFSVYVTALRYIECALRERQGTVCISEVTPEILNVACEKIRSQMTPSSAYSIALHIQSIYRSCVQLGLVTAPTNWHSIIRPSRNFSRRVGEEFDRKRMSKLPSPLALIALADLFNRNDSHPIDILISSLCALMLCVPERANEMLQAPLSLLGQDWIDPISGEIGTGLRWLPAKGGQPVTKTVIPSMRDIAVRAIERLTTLGAPARKIAKWYEVNPNKLYLNPAIEHLRSNEYLTTSEVGMVLHGPRYENTRENNIIVTTWLNRRRIPSTRIPRNGILRVKFVDVEAAILKLLPHDFPIFDKSTGMLYSEALCIVRPRELWRHETPQVLDCGVQRISYSILSGGLTSRPTGASVFMFHDFTDENGAPLSINSHMLRHYLNTLIQSSGKISQEDIARWSGRKSTAQNQTYNHQSDRDIIEKFRTAVGDPNLAHGPIANIDNRVFIRREEFASLKILTAHTTEQGYCVHDFAQSPCQIYRDCTNCDEHLYVKGDQRCEKHILSLHQELVALSESAKEAFDQNILNSAEWYAHHLLTLERVEKILSLLNDPAIKPGAVIQLSGINPPSRIAMAEESRSEISKPALPLKSIPPTKEASPDDKVNLQAQAITKHRRKARRKNN